MGEWIVSKRHIDVLVAALDDRGLLDGKTRDEAGQILWEENHRNIYQREDPEGYDEEDNVMPEYFFSPAMVELTPSGLLKQVDCYEYQTAGTDDYRETTAHALVKVLRSALVSEGAAPENTDYKEAPWGM